jgi:hypothetical protein
MSIVPIIKEAIRENGAVMISYDKIFGFDEKGMSIKPAGILTHTFSLVFTGKKYPYYYCDQYTQTRMPEDAVDLILNIMNNSIVVDGNMSIYVYIINTKYITSLE